MKLLHIVLNLGYGGAEKFVVELSNEMTKYSKVSLLILYSKEDNQKFYDLIDEKIEVINLNKKIGLDFSIILQIKKIIEDIQPTIVNTHCSSIDYTLLAALTNRKVKFFHTIHNDALMECPSSKRRFLRKYFYKKNIIHPITISKMSQKSFLEVYGSKIKNTLIFNGVKQEVFKESTFNRKVLKFICVGRLVPQKNQFELVKAFEILNRDGVKAELDIYGNLYERNRYYGESIIELSNKIPGVTFKGVVNDIKEKMSNCDAFILPSIFEGLPITLLEASMVGCIPLCTNVGGNSQVVIDGETGIIIEAPSSEKILLALYRFLSLNLEQRQKLSSNAMGNYKRNYTINVTARNYSELYNSELSEV